MTGAPVANGRPVGAGDTLPARYLPFSLFRERNFDLDEFPSLYSGDALQMYPSWTGSPISCAIATANYFSAYSPGPGILAVPVYLLTEAGTDRRLAKAAAAFSVEP